MQNFYKSFEVFLLTNSNYHVHNMQFPYVVPIRTGYTPIPFKYCASEMLKSIWMP